MTSSISNGFDHPVGPGFFTEAIDGDGYYSALDFGAPAPGTGEFHLGEDWNGSQGGNSDLGEPVLAASNGEVTEVGATPTLGDYIIIRHDLLQPILYGGVTTTQVFTLYAHLDVGSGLVSVGDIVTRGDKIGEIGSTGSATEAHLHFEVRMGSSFTDTDGLSATPMPTGWVDPTDFINTYRTIDGGTADLIGRNVSLRQEEAQQGQTIRIEYEIANIGHGAAGTTNTGVYLSTNDFISTGDTLLGTFASTGSDNPGAVDFETFNVTLPSSLGNGTYYIGVIADYDNALVERDENNNGQGTPAGTGSGVAIEIVAPGSNPDLVGRNVTIDRTALRPGDQTSVRFNIDNVGSGTSSNTTTGVYLSTNNFISTGDTLLATQLSSIGNGPGGLDPEFQNVTIPSGLAAGTYYIGVLADYNAMQAETDETNNGSGSGVAVTILDSSSTRDLAAQNVNVSKTVPDLGDTITVEYEIANLGTRSVSSTNAGIYLSQNSIISTADTFLTSRSSFDSLNPGDIDLEFASVTLPSDLNAGTYYIGVIADYTNTVSESDESNNASSGFAITIPNPGTEPDLTAGNVALSHSTRGPGGQITVTYDISNIGARSSIDTFAGIYLSENSFISDTDTLLKTQLSTDSNNPGDVDSESETVTLPDDLAPGTYYLGVIADQNSFQSESNEGNNASGGVAFTVINPDQAALRMGDLDGGGTDDLFWRNKDTGAVWLWSMETGSVVSKFLNSANPVFKLEGVGDFDGGGVDDILWRNKDTGAVWMWSMETGSVVSKFLDAADPVFDKEGVGDFNGGGTTDVLWRNENTGAVWAWEMESGTPVSKFLGTAVPVFKMEGTGDMTGGGTDDILWRNSESGAVWLWQMESGTPAPQFLGTVGSSFKMEGIGDFNGGGTDDIIWRNKDTGAVWLWEMESGTPSPRFLGSANPAFKTEATGDLSNGGTDDVVWRNEGTGAVWLWELESGSPVSRFLGTASSSFEIQEPETDSLIM